MSATAVRLIRPTIADIPFIMATERTPGYERLLGRSEAGWHQAALHDPRLAYFVGAMGGESIGFAILTDWAARGRATHIKRFAVVRPGRGLGKPFLRAVIGAVFQQTSAYRLSLGLFPENLRALRVYEGAGFRPEGVSRGSAYFEGVNRDELVMAIVRPDWERIHRDSP